jgi:hypothetical protein
MIMTREMGKATQKTESPHELTIFLELAVEKVPDMSLS